MTLPRLRDVSNWQGPVDWRTERRTVAGCYVKVAQGANYVDPSGQRRIRNATSAGMWRVGGYNFLTPGVGSPEAQADHLLALAPLAPGRLRPCLDVEQNPAGLSAQQLAAWVAACVLRVEQRVGYMPVVYGSPSFLAGFAHSDLTAAHVLGRCPLWIADYGVKVPVVPAPWVGWAAWQWTDSFRDPAVGRVDDSFIADINALTVPWSAKGRWLLPGPVRKHA